MMKHTFTIILFASIIVLGGCLMGSNGDVEQPEDSRKDEKPKDMPIEDLPDVRAFQDDFTRGFLQSTEETRPGYYPFLSGTGAFEMDFPNEGKIGERSYNIKNKSFEVLLIDVGNEKSNIIHNITMKYYNYLEEGLHKDTTLGLIQSGLGEDLNFERIEKDNQIYHISEFESNKEEDSPENYGYAALVLNKQDLGGIEIIYDSNCLENCEEDRERDKEEIFNWVMSVKLLQEPIDSDQNER